MLYPVCLGLFIPLVGFLFLLTFARYLSRTATGIIASGTVLVSFICFLVVLLTYIHPDIEPTTYTLYHWISAKDISADFALRIDPLSLVMTMIITGVGFLIHVYSIGYTDHEEDYVRFFAAMNLFIFSMLLLVLAANLLLLFVGWEGVGLASYLLIGYYYQRPSAAAAAVKAFVVNRIGDLGLLLGILLTFYLFHTTDIEKISQLAPQQYAVGATIITVLTLLYFIGAMGKSAQLPLHVWLPDAMEGPTPVSALIHAATMVTAGVYLVVRMHDLFMLAPITLAIVGIIGAATALFAALSACAQTDLKKVLAYSTVSQLGLMFLACGVGAFYAAMFHLTTHAFVKALLFLSAGNVVHMLHGTTEMDHMGNLRKLLPKTNVLFLIGVLAMSGVPPLAAFFSKDLILEQEAIAGYYILFAVAVVASILTAFYLTRAYCLAFLGESRVHEEEKVQEAPFVMIGPVSVLAILATFGGFLGYAFGKVPILEEFLGEIHIALFGDHHSGNYVTSWETALSVIGALVGIMAGVILYNTGYKDRLGAPLAFLKKAFYFDQIYDYAIVKPLEWVARFIDKTVEPQVFDKSVKLAVQSAQGTGALLQKVQSGQIRSYVAWMVSGLVLVIVYLLV